MSDLSSAARDNLSDTQFAVPGKRDLPIHDATHAKLAWDMVDRTGDLSEGERATAKRRIRSALKRYGVDTNSYSKSMKALVTAHEELEKSMENEEKGRLAKSLSALRSHFGIGVEDLTKGVERTGVMPGDEGYPNDQGAAAKIASARNKSKPAKTDQYEGVPAAEDDTTDYEDSEEDLLDGKVSKRAKKVTEKSMASQDEEDFYKALIAGDPTGDVVSDINATDALELMATTLAKSVAQMSAQVDARYAEMNKGMSLLAEALIEMALNKSEAPVAPAPATVAPATETQAPAETLEKSLTPEQVVHQKTLDFLAAADKMNEPSFFSQLSGTSLNKSQSMGNKPEDLNTPAGKQRVKAIITTLIKSNKISSDFLAMLDYAAPSEVVSHMPNDVRIEAGL